MNKLLIKTVSEAVYGMVALFQRVEINLSAAK